MTDEDTKLGLLAVATGIGGYVILKAALDDILEPKADRKRREEQAHFMLKQEKAAGKSRTESPLSEVVGFALVMTVITASLVELAEQYVPTFPHT